MPKKLLIADDSITIQKVMTITFPSNEYELVIVGNGEEAIKKFPEVKPDLVIADIGMPGKNGYEVCEAIKRSPETKDVPVLLLAGAFEPFDSNKAKSVGADDYIVKPFETQALINKVNELLAKRAQRVEVAEKPAEAEIAEIEESLDMELSEVVEAEAVGEAEVVEEGAVATAEESAVEAGEIVEEEPPSVSAKPAEKEDLAPEDLWSMEGFEGVEERREPSKVEEAVEVSEEVVEAEEGVLPLAEEIGAEPSPEEEAIPLEEGVSLQEEGISEPVEAEAVPEEAISVEETIQEAIEVAEPVGPAIEQAEVKEAISKDEILKEIQRQVSELLCRLLPRLVEKITEEVIGSIAKGFVKEAIEKSNIHEVTKRMIEEELKKGS